MTSRHGFKFIFALYLKTDRFLLFRMANKCSNSSISSPNELVFCSNLYSNGRAAARLSEISVRTGAMFFKLRSSDYFTIPLGNSQKTKLKWSVCLNWANFCIASEIEFACGTYIFHSGQINNSLPWPKVMLVGFNETNFPCYSI